MDKIIAKNMDVYREILETSKPCLAKNYLPYPPRLWNRTISPCYGCIEAVDVFVPYLKRNIPTKELGSVISMFRKGNVLQYKANSSNYSKNTIYSKIFPMQMQLVKTFYVLVISISLVITASKLSKQ
jgi:hypothetical protein